MKKRLLAAALWFYVSWYAWSLIAAWLTLPDVLGPLVALAIAGFVGLDPLHRIWNRALVSEPSALSSLEPETA